MENSVKNKDVQVAFYLILIKENAHLRKLSVAQKKITLVYEKIVRKQVSIKYAQDFKKMGLTNLQTKEN